MDDLRAAVVAGLIPAFRRYASMVIWVFMIVPFLLTLPAVRFNFHTSTGKAQWVEKTGGLAMIAPAASLHPSIPPGQETKP
jgi:hypothetical protein